MPSNFENFVISEPARGPVSKIVETHHCADNAARRLRVRRNCKPLVQSSALVGLKMTESNPAKISWIHNRRHSLQRYGKRPLESRMHEEGFLIPDNELIELNSIIGMERRYTKSVRGNFSYRALHRLSSGFWSFYWTLIVTRL